MFKKKDLYSYSRFCPLINPLDNNNPEIGSIFLEYQVTRYHDLQLKDISSIQNKKRKFLVHCTQRINIFNPDGVIVSPNNNLTSYNNYPVMINTQIGIAPENLDFQLLDYSPQTVNTKVQSSGTSGSEQGSATGNSTSSTIGSSTSQTNSYGASVSVGFDLSGSVSANYERSTTVSEDQSYTSGTDSSRSKSADTSASAEMSIKDWGAYAFVNPKTKSPTWTFGQEYPWDAIECRKTDGTPNKDNSDQTKIIIPSAMSLRLYDSVSLYPPSHLSMFGVNFVMKALWLVPIESHDSDEITIQHVVNYFSGSHILDGSSVDVYMDKQPIVLNIGDKPEVSTTIDLALMALDPIGSQNTVIGFIPNKFIIQPSPAGNGTPPSLFKIISAANTLMAKDTTPYPSSCDARAGFTPGATALTAAFSQNCTTLSMTLYFKVVDPINDYTLFIKHWKTGTVGVILTLVINDDTDNSITKYVDALEAEGGENNLMAITLRNQDYATVDYHDYLQLGLNSIQITIQPIGGQYTGCGYQIRAISIEKG